MSQIPYFALVMMMAATSRMLFLQTSKEQMIRDKVLEETKWGIKEHGEKKWAIEEAGRVTHGNVILFHGTDTYILKDILKGGVRRGFGPEEDEMGNYIYLATTPYLGFFFGNVCLKVRVPLRWVDDAGDGVAIEHDIRPEMILDYRRLSDWE